MEINQSVATTIAERIILPTSTPSGEFQRSPGCATYVDTRNFPAAYSTFPLKSRRMTNPLHDVKVTWFTNVSEAQNFT